MNQDKVIIQSCSRDRAKKYSFTSLNLLFLSLKTIFDCTSRIFLFSTWLYVVNDGQFSSTKTVIAYYSTLLILMIFNTIVNKNEKLYSAKNWIGMINTYFTISLIILNTQKLCSILLAQYYHTIPLIWNQYFLQGMRIREKGKSRKLFGTSPHLSNS